MDYHRVGGLRVGRVGRDSHEVDLNQALRENATSEKRGVRREKHLDDEGQTLKRIRSSLG